jgi:hypothetical protein
MKAKFLKDINHKLKYRLFLLQRLPIAFFTGLKMETTTEEKCIIRLKYSWWNKNPFKSMYFASQAMAAEMSTGVLCLGYIQAQATKVSMLVTQMEVAYSKRGLGKILFTCNDGLAIKHCIEQAVSTQQPQQFVATAIGTNEQNEIVATFKITWGFKAK